MTTLNTTRFHWNLLTAGTAAMAAGGPDRLPVVLRQEWAMSDLDIILEKTVRSYGRRQIQAGHALMIVMVREIPHPIGEVWSAIADRERLGQWVALPEGDLRRGGSYSLPDGSHGAILRCDGPRLLTVSWAREGTSVAEVEFHLTGEDGHTRFELRYASVRKGFAVSAAPGAGLWTGGAGWEYFLDVLEDYLAGRIPDEPPGIQFEIESEGTLADLFEARNQRWRQTADDFDQEHIP